MAALTQHTVQQAAIQSATTPDTTKATHQAASPQLIYHPQAGTGAADSAGSSCPGVVHLGLGGFHRAHQAMVFDALIAQGDLRWSICAVGMRSDKLARQIDAQDFLYLVRVSDAKGSQWHAPSAIVKTLVAATERDAVIAQIANPHNRWLTLTITEKAYTPELAQLIVAGLRKRMTAGLGGLTIASCDNLPDNGRVLSALCLEQAGRETHEPELRAWIETECQFPSSMVDRIVPAPSNEVRMAGQRDLGLDDPTALGVEAFWEWVIEDAFVDPADADALRSVGVVVTDNVAGFEQAKLWMLNGSHTILASAGAVLGDAYIRQVIARPAMRRFINGFMTHASGPLVGRPNWQAYRDALIDRFGNPMIDHACLQVYSDSSQKIPVRWVPVGERLLGGGAGGDIGTRAGLDYLAMAVAIFARSLLPASESGEPFAFNDPAAPVLQGLAKQQQTDPAGVIEALLTDAKAKAVFGNKLGQDTDFVKAASVSLASIHALGLEAAVQSFVEKFSDVSPP